MKKNILLLIALFLSSSAFAQMVDFTDININTEQKVLGPKDPVGRVFANFALGAGPTGGSLGGRAGWFKTHGAYIGMSGYAFGGSGEQVNFTDFNCELLPSGAKDFTTMFGYIFSPARSKKTGKLQSNWFQLFTGIGPTIYNVKYESNDRRYYAFDPSKKTCFSFELGAMFTLGCGLNFIYGFQFMTTKPQFDFKLNIGIGWTFGKCRN